MGKERFCLLLVTVFFALALAPAFTTVAQELPPPSAKVAPLPNLKPGSWWLLRGLGGKWTARVELKHVEDGGFIVSVNGRQTEYTNEWNRLEYLEYQRTIRDRYNPHNRFLSFPLWPGKKWGGIVAWTGRRGLMSQGTFSVHGEAKEWERIEVPAGTFEAIRVEVLSGRTTVICWYAIDVQRLAKCESPSRPHLYSWELVGFHLTD